LAAPVCPPAYFWSILLKSTSIRYHFSLCDFAIFYPCLWLIIEGRIPSNTLFRIIGPIKKCYFQLNAQSDVAYSIILKYRPVLGTTRTIINLTNRSLLWVWVSCNLRCFFVHASNHECLFYGMWSLNVLKILMCCQHIFLWLNFKNKSIKKNLFANNFFTIFVAIIVKILFKSPKQILEQMVCFFWNRRNYILTIFPVCK
jgi:hypothetical protein